VAHCFPLLLVEAAEDSSGVIREGERRTIVAADQRAFQGIETPRGQTQNDANLVRESLTSYFLTDRGNLPWQWQHTRSTGPGLPTA